MLLLSISSVVIFGSQIFNNSNGSHSPASVYQAGPSKPPKLGIDCGLGSKEAVLNPSSVPVAPSENPSPSSGAFQTRSSCTWIGDIANYTGTPDKTLEPLVTDQDELFSTSCGLVPVSDCLRIGGGFTANIVYLQNGTSTLNGFDITVSYNASILHAAEFDQGGLGPWATAFMAVSTIDNTLGQARLGQVLVTSPLASNFTLFRIRFDVVGVGVSPLTLTEPSVGCGICTPGPVVHVIQSGAFDSETLFDPSRTVKWSGFWTFSPTPSVPGSPTTFTASTSCALCVAPLHYKWDVNSDGTIDAITNPATITIPNPALVGHRVTLVVYDSAPLLTQHNITMIQRLPFTFSLNGPATLPVNQAGTWNATWLGGIPAYSGSWRFCPGFGSVANAICAKPAPLIGSTQLQTNANSVTYYLSGLYNDSVTLFDAGSPVLGSPNKAQPFFLVNITGTPQAFTVSTTPASNATVGRPVTITANILYNANYPSNFKSSKFNYIFTFGDGTSGMVASTLTASIIHTYSSTGTYNIKVVAQETSSAAVSKIQESGFSTLLVATAVIGDFSSSPTPPLSGQPTSFTTTISGGIGPYLFSWTLGDGSTATGSTVTHTYQSSGSYTVTLNVTDQGGRRLVQSHSLSVSPGPLIGSLILPPTTPSSGQVLTFNATVTGGTAPYTYTWNFGDGTTGSGATPTHTYSSPGNYTVTITITDAGGRTTTLTRAVTVAGSTIQPTDYLLYGGIAAAVAIAAIVALLVLRRRKKPNAVAT
jgi:PKD repeat protein